ncbi:MAG TPA: methyltransferase domain-containing protein [Candidatus Stackebrandtia faecavium]|nr:methyltransferase domain-containing protein [Candidatus Stackebrandtia faecavium]
MAADWHAHAGRLASYLADNVLADPAWIEVFENAPRHEFGPHGLTLDHSGRIIDSAKWSRRQRLHQSYADQVLVTRFETTDDAHGPQATSSASQPIIVAAMLELLDVEPGAKVLEIGTGPGYNACLLSMRLGPEQVHSLDVQDDVVGEARANLARVGLKPHLTTGDGARGWPEHAPYDRIIATCAMPWIPHEWLGQLAPQARVVAPMSIGALLAVLDRRIDGTLEGRFSAEGACFMTMRTDERQDIERVYSGADNGEPVTVDIDGDVLSDQDFRLWLELCMPDLTIITGRAQPHMWVLATPHGRVEISYSEGRTRMIPFGAPLWRRISTALDSWLAHGRPGRQRLGLTVTSDSQWVWLDEPDSQLTWTL